MPDVTPERDAVLDLAQRIGLDHEWTGHLFDRAARRVGNAKALDYVGVRLTHADQKDAGLLDLHLATFGPEARSSAPFAWRMAGLERDHAAWLRRVREAEDRARVRERARRHRARRHRARHRSGD